jgi:tRNA uridine 5-carboxymethylaminomethyl modification enzyme
LVRSLPGLENAHILRPGYAIEYDYFDPRGLKASFETRAISGLFFAGQINGTTGYEEAAAQGLFAGINAALHCRGESAWLPRRDEAYLGVLVDDLITKGVTEPYRMFTSRAEFRLQLREDNADMRLTDAGRRLGLVDDERWATFNRKRDAVSRETERLKATWVNPRNLPAAEAERVLGKGIDHEYNLGDLLRRPDVRYEALVGMEGGRYRSAAVAADVLGELYAPVVEQIEIAAKYSGYIDRQKDEVERAAYYENLRLPAELDYMQVAALSIEVRQKLSKHRPETLGLASRISGVTPAAISLLLVHLKKNKFKGFGDAANQQDKAAA